MDFRTTAQTVVPVIAKELHMSIWERSVFIDNEQDKDTMKKQIECRITIAEKTGTAVLISHVVTVELTQILTDMHYK